MKAEEDRSSVFVFCFSLRKRATCAHQDGGSAGMNSALGPVVLVAALAAALQRKVSLMLRNLHARYANRSRLKDMSHIIIWR